MTGMAALDAETRAADAKPELRLWLRLLATTTLVEREIRGRLAERFDVTLPRFDLLAQLEKAPNGLTLGDISRRMMVTNGNVTGLVARAVEQGLVARRRDKSDGRSQRISLTDKGRATFSAIAREHAAWVHDLLAGLTPEEREALMALLARTKASVSRAARPEPAR